MATAEILEIPKKKLKPQHEVFCQAMFRFGKGKTAAIKAGYSEVSAAAQACELLKRPDIQERMAEVQKEQFKLVDATQQFVWAESMNDLMFGRLPSNVKIKLRAMVNQMARRGETPNVSDDRLRDCLLEVSDVIKKYSQEEKLS